MDGWMDGCSNQDYNLRILFKSTDEIIQNTAKISFLKLKPSPVFDFLQYEHTPPKPKNCLELPHT